jgi:hypothetical protein
MIGGGGRGCFDRAVEEEVEVGTFELEFVVVGFIGRLMLLLLFPDIAT